MDQNLTLNMRTIGCMTLMPAINMRMNSNAIKYLAEHANARDVSELHEDLINL